MTARSGLVEPLGIGLARRVRSARIGSLFVAASLATSAQAQAQTLDESYAVELTRGPVTGPAQIVGMAGAITSMAAGAGAQQFNPAAVANRYEYNPDTFFDWDFEIDGFFTQVVPFRIDLENNGLSTDDGGGDDIAEISTALALNFGRLGVGFTASAVSYSFLDEGRSYTAYQIAPTAGYNFLNGQLVVGGGVQFALATLEENVDLLRLSGIGFTGGAIYRPEGLPFRVGASFATGLIYGQREVLVEQTPAGVTLVRGLEVPWQVTLGASGTIGPRWKNYNRSFGGVQGRAAVNRARRYVTLSADLVFTGASDKATGFEAWATDTLQAAGEDLSVSFRLGADSEFWQNRMRGRIGYYYEPSRFQETDGRHHVTAGMDVHLFDLVIPWRATWAIDLAPRYTNILLSLGVWH